MSINLTKILKAKQAETKLSNEALAKAIGVSTVSVSGVLKGKSKPNATTAKKYSSYLGVELAELSSAPEESGKRTKKTKKSRGATGAKQVTASSRKSSSRGLGADLVSAVQAAAAVLDDGLAIAVHKAGKMERELVARLLGV